MVLIKTLEAEWAVVKDQEFWKDLGSEVNWKQDLKSEEEFAKWKS